MNTRSLKYFTGLCCVTVAILAQTIFAAQGQDDRFQDSRWADRTILGTAYFIGGGRPSQSRQFSLRINQLTSAAGVQQLNQALQSGGQEELLSVL